MIRTSKRRYWIGLSAAVILIIAGLWIIGPKLFRKGTEASAVRENSIAVMYFEDRSREENFGKILAEMLTSNLSRCKQIDVISSQYLFDILKKMGKEDTKSIDRNMATEIAENARVQTMLLGSIDKIGSRININAQLCDVKTGSVIGPAMAGGARVEDIYDMVNTLTDDVIALMDVSQPETQQSFNINDVTTHCFEAYQQYHKGLELIRQFDWSEAGNQFRIAIEIDSTFAMAHCWLAYSASIFKVSNPLSDLSKERKLICRAKQYASNTTDLERAQIEIVDAMLQRDMQAVIILSKKAIKQYQNERDFYKNLSIAYGYSGKPDSAIQSLMREFRIDSDVPNTYLLLAYNYSRLNDHQKAIAAVNKYITLQPDVMNTYDSAIDIYLKAGMYDEALQICEKALIINPDWTEFIQMQGIIYLLMGDGDKACDKNRLALKVRPDWEPILTDDLGCFALYEGRYREAADAFKKVISLAKEEGNTTDEIAARLILGKFYSVQKAYDLAFKEFSSVKALSQKLENQSYNTWPVRADYYWGVTAIDKGELEEAYKAANRIKNYIENKGYDSILLDYYYLLLAELNINQSQPEKALKKMDEVSPFSRMHFPRCRMLTAEIQALNGNTESAIETYKRLFHNWETAKSYHGGNWFDYFQVRSMIKYKIARLYDKAGDRKSAFQYYQEALDQWKNADNDLPEKVNAEKRLSRLKDEK
jgi:tetratricopeptide (TPR) repeat protein